jgi:hypothetical protein
LCTFGKDQRKYTIVKDDGLFQCKGKTGHFYKRLTTRLSSKNKANKHHPVEDDPSLTPAEKRYDRVRK